MKSNIALCLYGLPRGNISTWKSLRNNVIEPLHISKVFIDTWLINRSVGRNWHGYREPESKNLLNYTEFWTQIEHTQKISVNKPLDQQSDLFSTNIENTFVYNQVSMWTSIYRAVCAALQHNNIEYIMCTRPDLLFTHTIKIDLNYDEQAAVEEFTVEFRYQYFESNTTT